MSRLAVSPGYFYTLGIPLLKGRTFTDHDDEQAPKAAVVNEALASHFWPGEDPIGRKLPLLGDKLIHKSRQKQLQKPSKEEWS